MGLQPSSQLQADRLEAVAPSAVRQGWSMGSVVERGRLFYAPHFNSSAVTSLGFPLKGQLISSGRE